MEVFMLPYFCEKLQQAVLEVFSKCYLFLVLGTGPSQLCLQTVQSYVFDLDIWLGEMGVTPEQHQKTSLPVILVY